MNREAGIIVIDRSNADEEFAKLSTLLMTNTQVSQPEGKKGFGSSALRINGKIFALLSREKFVVKLPKQRVEELVASGNGQRFDPRRNGKVMKEWLVIGSKAQSRWLSIAKEAMDFALEK